MQESVDRGANSSLLLNAWESGTTPKSDWKKRCFECEDRGKEGRRSEQRKKKEKPRDA